MCFHSPHTAIVRSLVHGDRSVWSPFLRCTVIVRCPGYMCVCVFGEVVYNVVPSWIHSGLESRAKFQNMIGSRRSLQLSRCSASYSTSVCAQSCIYRSGQRCLCSTATSSRPIIVGRMNMDGSWTNHTNKRVAGTPRFAIRPFLKQIVNNGYDKIFCFVFPFWNL